MISKDELHPELIAIGKLMGLLIDGGGNVAVNIDWFSHPAGELGKIGTRIQHLVELLEPILKTPVEKAPAVFQDAQWRPIPNPVYGSGMAFHIITPKATENHGELGFGILRPFHIGNITIQAYVYIPLFNYSRNGISFVLSSKENPCRIGLNVTAMNGFNSGQVSYDALDIDTRIYMANKTPEFTLEFIGLKGAGGKPSKYTTLDSLLNSDVALWAGDALVQASYWLHMYVGNSTYTVGDILKAANFLLEDDSGYHLEIKNLKGKTAMEIARNFVFAVFDALSTVEFPVIHLPGGGLYLEHRKDSGDYGIRLVTDIEITSSQNVDGSASPAINLCLGTWLEGEDGSSNWVKEITGSEVKPGISFFFLNRKEDKMEFITGLEMQSVGINIRGCGDKPLLDTHGYTLKGAEIRTCLDSKDWKYGFALQMDSVGIPLGPSFDKAQNGNSSTNTVVKNILASSKKQNGSNGEGAVNPSFSAKVAYINERNKDYYPLLQIFDSHGNKNGTIWFPVQRRFGPVDCKKLGIRLDSTGSYRSDPLLGISFDGNVTLYALDVHLDQLYVGMHLKRIADISGYEMDLQGMGVDFKSGQVSISGGLLKNTDEQGVISYDGSILLRFGNLSISGVGSYSSLPNNGGTSMFIFAMLNQPLGGPAFFYVTGLAAGFGYNRTLKIPEMDKVHEFPLIAGLTDPSAIGGDNPKPSQALATLRKWVPPEKGAYWLAAGVQFTTFRIINTSALLVVQFGNELAISVLGISVIKQPQNVEHPYVYAEIDIEVLFRPQKGELKASAVLAAGSYVLTKEAHLTGGFAFYSWFGENEHAGDFVFTIGGYHPAFNVPAHYPKVPRVGINWQVSDCLSIVGGAYFAITPAAMMAGNGIEITFHKGPLKAWLKAQMDMLLFWKPFYLLVDASVRIGASLRVCYWFVDKTISIEVGADLHMWGPPVGGSVYVDLSIISFTIEFGKEKNPPNEISWKEFKEMLPTKMKKSSSLDSDAAEDIPACLYINACDGLQDIKEEKDVKHWLVRPGQFRFTVGSAIPATSILVEDISSGEQYPISGKKVGIQRVNGGISPDDYQSTQTISIRKLSNETDPSSDLTALKRWEVNAVDSNMPNAMWGKRQTIDINSDNGTIPAVIGVVVYPKQPDLNNGTPEMDVDDVFKDRIVNELDKYRLPLYITQQPFNNIPKDADSFADIVNVNESNTAGRRERVFEALRDLGYDLNKNDPLPKMAANPGADFADEPMEGSTVPN